jgi:hypothetical protein
MATGIIDKPTSSVADTSATSAEQSAPNASAPFDVREAWCLDYAMRLIARVPGDGALPPDARPTQRFENEFNSCKLDPREYERETRTEMSKKT